MKQPRRTACRKHAAFGAAVAVAAFAAAADADETVTGSVSQSIRGSTNPRLATTGDDPALISSTRLNLSYASATPRSTFSVGGGINYSLATGSDNSDLTGLFPDLSGGYSYNFDDAALTFGFGLSVQPVTFLASADPLFDESGQPVEETEDRTFGDDSIEIAYRGNVGFSQTIDARNSYNLFFSASRRDFTESTSTLTPTTNAAFGGGWSRSFSPTLTGGVSTSLSYFQADNAQSRESYTWNVNANFNHQASSQLSINGRLGPSLSYSTDTDQTTGDRSSETRATADFGFNVAYEGLRTSYYAGFSNDVVPTSDGGSLTNLASLTFGATHQINTGSSLRLSNALSYRSDLFGGGGGGAAAGDQLYFTTGLTYSYAVTQTVNANVGYAFRWRDTDGARADEHALFVTLSKAFTLLP